MNQDMQGRVVVITGATSGIGQVAAEVLAGKGARIIQVARDRERGEVALKRLRECAPGAAHAIYYADLSRLSEMKRVASEIAGAEPHIDVLVNNAGALFGNRQVTEDGLERTFALNHLAYFVLTRGLRERLVASAPARIVNTASDAHESASLDFDDLQSVEAYRSSLWAVVAVRRTWLQGVWPVEAVQHPLHARTRPAASRHWCDSQLPSSWVRSHSLWRPERRTDLFWCARRQTLCFIAPRGLGNTGVFSVVACGGRRDRQVLSQMPSCNALQGSAR